jgi:hypothetical protein
MVTLLFSHPEGVLCPKDLEGDSSLPLRLRNTVFCSAQGSFRMTKKVGHSEGARAKARATEESRGK